MFARFLEFLNRRGRKRIVMDRVEDRPYLERYYLFLKNRDNFPFNIFLHHFLCSDPDDVHDHPWPYFTIILRGGYWEWVPQFNASGEKTGEIAKWRAPGHFRWCSARSFHRIELDPAVDCWTLFVPGVKQREWGFLSKGRWIQWQDYLKQRKAKV